MKLIIKSLDGKVCKIDFDLAKTVWDLKTYLSNMNEFPIRPERLELMHSGQLLFNTDILKQRITVEKCYIIAARNAFMMERDKNGKRKIFFTTLQKGIDGNAAEGASKEKPIPLQVTPTRSELQMTKKELKKFARYAIKEKVKNKMKLKEPQLSIGSQTSEIMLRDCVSSPPLNVDIALMRDFMRLGFTRTESRRALIASSNNAELAVKFLIHSILEKPEKPPFQFRPHSTNSLTLIDDSRNFSKFRMGLQYYPELLIKVLFKVINVHPKLMSAIREEDKNMIVGQETSKPQIENLFKPDVDEMLKVHSNTTRNEKIKNTNTSAITTVQEISTELVQNVSSINEIQDDVKHIRGENIPSSITRVAQTVAEHTSISSTSMDVEVLVDEIMCFGFKEDEVRRALRSSSFNKTDAVEYLIEKIPARVEILLPQIPRESQTVFNFLLRDQRFLTMRRVFQHYPHLLRKILAKIKNLHPDVINLLRNNEEEFARLLCEEDTPMNADVYCDSIEKNLTDKDMTTVKRISALGFPIKLVMKAFLANSKNEKKTIRYLTMMIN